ncbi:Protein of unknown function [Acetanaerobacterium elongatum]|uniref:DUF3102 domain-containing protein n=2 Tax=Acetanaerobacterium elongatum TaxID=258515 RepID=A0A1G9YZ59_9FIRM|nr:Protein of unknown function [Acetanaerobacterium elongatum]
MYIRLVPQKPQQKLEIEKEDNIMSELTAPVAMEATQHDKAVELHQYILAQGQVVAHGLTEIGRSLKEMRDQKLYIELGHDTFEAYTEQMLNLKQRQAYNYISIYETYGPKFIDTHGDLGISKLLLLESVPALEREEFLEEHDVGDMSVRELKEITDKYNKACEQISLLQDELKDKGVTAEAEHRLLEENAALAAKVKELENRPIDVAVQQPSAEDIAKIKKQAEKDAKASTKAEIEKAVEKAKKEAQQAADERVKQAKEAAEKATEERIKQSLEQVEKEKTAALEREDRLKKQLAVTGNSDSVLFAHVFEEYQSNFNRLLGIIKKIEATDQDTAAKLRGALKKITISQLEQAGE